MAAAPGRSSLARARPAILISAGLGAGGYLAFALWSGWEDVARAAQRVGAWSIAAAFALSLVNYGLRFARWQLYLARLGHAVPWRASLRIYLAGFALTTVPGKVGEAVRSLFLAPHGVPIPRSLAAFFAERLTDLMSMLALAFLGALSYPPARTLAAMVAAVIGAALIALASPALIARLRDALARRAHKRLAQLAGGLLDVVRSARACLAPGMLAASLALGFIAWGAEGYALHLLLHGLGPEIELSHAVFIYAFAMLAGALSFMPGGLGGTEAAMVALLALHGFSLPVAVAVTVLVRVATLWFAVALGVFALARLERTARAA